MAQKNMWLRSATLVLLLCLVNLNVFVEATDRKGKQPIVETQKDDDSDEEPAKDAVVGEVESLKQDLKAIAQMERRESELHQEEVRRREIEAGASGSSAPQEEFAEKPVDPVLQFESAPEPISTEAMAEQLKSIHLDLAGESSSKVPKGLLPPNTPEGSILTPTKAGPVPKPIDVLSRRLEKRIEQIGSELRAHLEVNYLPHILKLAVLSEDFTEPDVELQLRLVNLYAKSVAQEAALLQHGGKNLMVFFEKKLGATKDAMANVKVSPPRLFRIEDISGVTDAQKFNYEVGLYARCKVEQVAFNELLRSIQKPIYDEFITLLKTTIASGLFQTSDIVRHIGELGVKAIAATKTKAEKSTNECNEMRDSLLNKYPINSELTKEQYKSAEDLDSKIVEASIDLNPMPLKFRIDEHVRKLGMNLLDVYLEQTSAQAPAKDKIIGYGRGLRSEPMLLEVSKGVQSEDQKFEPSLREPSDEAEAEKLDAIHENRNEAANLDEEEFHELKENYLNLKFQINLMSEGGRNVIRESIHYKVPEEISSGGNLETQYRKAKSLLGEGKYIEISMSVNALERLKTLIESKLWDHLYADNEYKLPPPRWPIDVPFGDLHLFLKLSELLHTFALKLGNEKAVEHSEKPLRDAIKESKTAKKPGKSSDAKAGFKQYKQLLEDAEAEFKLKKEEATSSAQIFEEDLKELMEAKFNMMDVKENRKELKYLAAMTPKSMTKLFENLLSNDIKMPAKFDLLTTMEVWKYLANYFGVNDDDEIMDADVARGYVQSSLRSDKSSTSSSRN